jgi:hypothetical protein
MLDTHAIAKAGAFLHLKENGREIQCGSFFVQDL